MHVTARRVETTISREQLPREVKRSSVLVSADTANAPKRMKQVANRKDSRMKLKERIRCNAPINEYVKGEIVLGTIPGYAPWPARIREIAGETNIIEFFGTGEM